MTIAPRTTTTIIQVVLFSTLILFSTRTKPNGGCKVLEVTAWSSIPPRPMSAQPAFQTRRRDAKIITLWSKSDESDDAISTISMTASSSATVGNGKKQDLEACILQLKRVIEREYITFFDPMECDYYRNDVKFIDPLTTLTGIDSYLNNVNMLSGRTMLGSILFREARIILHTITGGTVHSDDDDDDNPSGWKIDNIITRWTLKFTFQALPWQPSPSFTGISVYSVQAGGPRGVQVVQQNDYWDSINLQPGGSYEAVSNSVALQHFVSLLLPSSTFQAKSAGPELPYTTLRLKGSEYEVRRYPSYTALAMIYERRDEAFVAMGSYTSGMNPMAPAIIQVNSTDPNNVIKTMLWPVQYTLPNERESSPPPLPTLPTDAPPDIVSIVTIPESVVAVRTFNDMIVEPLVRKVDQTLRQYLQRDGLLPYLYSENVKSDNDNNITTTTTKLLTFAQYDAIYSMGERRCEVHVPLSSKYENNNNNNDDGLHPW